MRVCVCVCGCVCVFALDGAEVLKSAKCTVLLCVFGCVCVCVHVCVCVYGFVPKHVPSIHISRKTRGFRCRSDLQSFASDWPAECSEVSVDES